MIAEIIKGILFYHKFLINKGNQNLKVLKLMKNKINDEGAMSIIETLPLNNVEIHLNFITLIELTQFISNQMILQTRHLISW